MNFGSGTYIISNLLDREFVDVTVLFSCIENWFCFEPLPQVCTTFELNPHFSPVY